MAVNVNPYLQFRGTAREAMEFYASVLGGEATFATFGEFGLNQRPEDADLVMHSQLVIEGRAFLMASDAPEGMALPESSSIAVALFGGSEDLAQMTRQWEQLSDGGTIVEPLVQAPWGDHFGMVTDRFGTFWMVNIGGDQQA